MIVFFFLALLQWKCRISKFQSWDSIWLVLFYFVKTCINMDIGVSRWPHTWASVHVESVRDKPQESLLPSLRGCHDSKCLHPPKYFFIANFRQWFCNFRSWCWNCCQDQWEREPWGAVTQSCPVHQQHRNRGLQPLHSPEVLDSSIWPTAETDLPETELAAVMSHILIPALYILSFH